MATQKVIETDSIRKVRIGSMKDMIQIRKWFREKFDYMADDATVLSAWNTHRGKA